MQPLDQVPVQFDHRESAQPLDQGLGQGCQSGPDLDHGLARTRIDGPHDGFDHRLVVQEMLAEALARNVLHVVEGIERRRAAP